ncbi:hypothetical protein C3941_19420 [Kaistia algarum]|nr:hypothetical protein C3941_19420 [Kaistia algarum]
MYGAVLVSLPLLFLVLWALPTVLPAVLRGNFSGFKVALGAVWGVVVFACPFAALAFRRQYQYREEWHRPRRLSIAFASIGYFVSLVSYAGLALTFLKLPI